MQTDLSWCVGDGACTRFTVNPVGGGLPVKACPAFEEIVITRQRAPEPLIDRLDFSQLPCPQTAFLDRPWHGYLAGVGGMDIGTATAILVLAGHQEGYRVQFCDKKGLAIRNGGVYSMITFAPAGAPFTSNLIPYGKADLILGLDALEAVRALDPATNQRVGSRRHTAAIVNTHKTPTILTLLGKHDFDVASLETTLRQHTRTGSCFSENVSALSERFFGTQLYANIIMLGMAFQHGLLPLRLASLETGIRKSFGPAADSNLKAFQLGRLLAAHPAVVHQAAGHGPEPTTFADVVSDRAALLDRSRPAGRTLAESYRRLVHETASQLELPDADLAAFARRVADLIEFEDLAYAQRYVDAVLAVHRRDSPTHHHAATRAVLWNLHRVMTIKDEIYVAHLLTSEEKRRRDRARYQVDPTRGDRIEYRHLNHPQFRLLGRDFAWNMKTRDWMLEIMKRLKWLRRALPDWHRPEKEFRDWYAGLLEQFPNASQDPHAYELFVRVLRLPKSVTGYREIRYPKMAAARDQASQWLAEIDRTTRGSRNLVPA